VLPVPVTPVMGSEATRNWIKFNISRKTWNTVSGAKILDALKAQGMGIREQDFYGIRREVMHLGYYEKQIQARSKTELIPRAWMHQVPRKVLTCNALYKTKMLVTNLETGEVEEWTRAIADDRHLTPQEILDIETQLVVSKLYEYNFELMEMQVSEVWIAEGAILGR